MAPQLDHLKAESGRPKLPTRCSPTIGHTEEGTESVTMHYCDSRWVFRVYLLRAEKGELKIWRDHRGFRQRFTCRLSDDGNTFGGTFELNEDEAGWNEALKISYRRPGG
jgi:hypothetical protein